MTTSAPSSLDRQFLDSQTDALRRERQAQADLADALLEEIRILNDDTGISDSTADDGFGEGTGSAVDPDRDRALYPQAPARVAQNAAAPPRSPTGLYVQAHLGPGVGQLDACQAPIMPVVGSADQPRRLGPVHQAATPSLLACHDVLAQAATGTAKTAAFALPVLQRLGRGDRGRQPGALILVPTRELAMQIDMSLRSYGRGLKLRHCVIFGGVSQNRQVQELAKGVDVLVATPGRLLDLITQRHLRLDEMSPSGVESAVRDALR